MQLTQAILPVAGLGTRFLPWTKAVPKELLPIGNRPVIAMLVDECLSVGIRDICFVISKGKEAILRFFREEGGLEAELARRGKTELLRELRKYDEVNIHVEYQEEQLGDGHAILQAANWIKSDHIAVLFGDDLIVGESGNGLEQLVRSYPVSGSVAVCLQDVPLEDVARYGIVETKQADGGLREITGIVEKPEVKDAPGTLAIVGKFVIPRKLFSVLPEVKQGHGGEIRLVDALISQLGKIPVYGYVFDGKRFDVGTPAGYREAVKCLG